MSMVKFIVKPRYMMPLMFGIIIGFTLSLFCVPFYECDHLSPSAKLNLLNDQKSNSETDDFEPRINLADRPKHPSKPINKIVRPRYLATELGIRKRLFVGILSSQRSLSSLVPLLNTSLSSYANKLTFFVNNPQMNENKLLDSTPPGISVVNFNDGNLFSCLNFFLIYFYWFVKI